MIDWIKYFDVIWCLDYKPMKVRKQLILQQFSRVGILNHPNFKFHQTFPSPYDQYFYNKLIIDKKIDTKSVFSTGVMNATFGHYACIKKSLLDNNQRALIIENDMRFLNDISKIQNTLNNLPTDYDIFLFDYFIHCSNQEFNTYKNKKINDYFCEYKNLASCGLYALSNKALIKLAEEYEKRLIVTDFYTSKINFDGVLKKCFTPQNLACQATFSDALNCRNGAAMNGIHNAYKKYNLNYNNYNMNEGKPYNYGDYIIEVL